jgi:flagellar biosynthesis/type III secretory pathway M-ring protein FliF/YscJ
MPEDDSAVEKSTEDIVERLEALRKKAPNGNNLEEKEKVEEESEEKPPTERRQRIARIVGIIVIFLVVAVVFFATYKVVYEPMHKKKVDATRIEQEQRQALINAGE